jgi:hypothetical protein
MAEVEEFQDTNRKVYYILFMDVMTRMGSHTRSSDDMQEKLLAIRKLHSRLRPAPASPTDSDIYIEKMAALGERLNDMEEGDDYFRGVDEILWEMVDTMNDFIEKAKIFKSEGKASVTGRPITREAMKEVSK